MNFDTIKIYYYKTLDNMTFIYKFKWLYKYVLLVVLKIK